MKRKHLIELEDQAWLPSSIRDAATDYLQFVIALGRPYGPILPRMVEALRKTGAHNVVDLCSGGGGPWPSMLLLVKEPIQVELTDMYPNEGAIRYIEAAANENLKYRSSPVDATALPAELNGFRTLFSSFHHFAPDRARCILQDAVEKRQGIAVFEATQRSAPAMLAIVISAFLVLVFTPFVRPFRLSRLFWTYLIPAVPLLVLFDGIVSCLRTYTPAELRALVNDLPASGHSFHWEIGEQGKRGALPVTFLIGYPDES